MTDTGKLIILFLSPLLLTAVLWIALAGNGDESPRSARPAIAAAAWPDTTGSSSGRSADGSGAKLPPPLVMLKRRPSSVALQPVTRQSAEATSEPRRVITPVPPQGRQSAQAPRTRTLRMLVTAYCPCPKCCGQHSDGKTASGRSVSANGSRLVAADTRVLPFGTRVSVPGYYSGAPVPVLDRGKKIRGHRLDVFFRSHSRAKRWGARWLDVTVYAD